MVEFGISCVVGCLIGVLGTFMFLLLLGRYF